MVRLWLDYQLTGDSSLWQAAVPSWQSLGSGCSSCPVGPWSTRTRSILVARWNMSRDHLERSSRSQNGFTSQPDWVCFASPGSPSSARIASCQHRLCWMVFPITGVTVLASTWKTSCKMAGENLRHKNGGWLQIRSPTKSGSIWDGFEHVRTKKLTNTNKQPSTGRKKKGNIPWFVCTFRRMFTLAMPRTFWTYLQHKKKSVNHSAEVQGVAVKGDVKQKPPTRTTNNTSPVGSVAKCLTKAHDYVFMWGRGVCGDSGDSTKLRIERTRVSGDSLASYASYSNFKEFTIWKTPSKIALHMCLVTLRLIKHPSSTCGLGVVRNACCKKTHIPGPIVLTCPEGWS